MVAGARATRNTRSGELRIRGYIAIAHDRSWHRADTKLRPPFGRFSNRPFGVKRLQTIHRCSVDVAHGLVLLFGIGTKALVWDFFSQEVQAWWRIFFSSSFFADLKVRFFFPGRLRSCDACQATL